LKSGKPAGILTGKQEYAKKYIKDGYTFVAVNSDTNLFAREAENLLKEFK
jgi:4-hydroxy-2-oxoheptanedioate aldolase